MACQESAFNIVLGVRNILNQFQQLRILTSEVSQDIILNFGQKYFGTE
jgi:hypothetical protein